MAAEIEMKFSLSGPQSIESMLKDELALKYVKDAFRTKESCSEYYDTHAWELSAGSYELRITRSEEPKVAVLKQGTFRDEDMPGLYRGSRWIAPYAGLDTVLPDLIERGAPREIAELADGRPLELCFYTILNRKYATLYMPDRTRVELCFDSGELIAGAKRMPLYELGLELLYGSEDLLLDYCRQLSERFSLSPMLLSRHERALRLLRTR